MPDDRPIVAVLLTPDRREEVIAPDALARLAARAALRLAEDGPLTYARIGQLAAGAAVLVTGWGTPPLDAAFLAAHRTLGLVAHAAGSVRKLLPASVLEEGRIRVTHAAVPIGDAVAEFVIAQALAFLRAPHRLADGMSVGIPWFELRRRQLGALLAARTVGIVGAGRIGRRLIGLFRAFEARVLVFDPFLSADAARGLDAEARPLDDLLRESDIVSLHVPLLPRTRRMIGAAQLAMLRDGALFINTAKAALVDQAAQLAALKTGRFTAALDVFDLEPLPLSHPLRALPNVILSPHAAGHTAESHLRQGDLVVDEICRFLAGEPLRHEITRAVVDTMA